MSWFAELGYLQEAPERIRKLPGFSETVPARAAALRRFGQHARKALRLLGSEPEIAVFAAAQWVAAGLAYALWLWGDARFELPAEFWSLQDLVDVLWAGSCLLLVACTTGFFTACIGAVHFLRMEGEPSTIFGCMGRAAPRLGALWSFTFVDAGLTAMQGAARIPVGRYWTPERFIEREALHYAWKVATVGILPALLAERSPRQAANEAVELARARLADAMLLRSGYNITCWIVAVATFALAFWQLRANASAVRDFAGGSPWFLALLISVGVVHLLVRPAYIIASSELYHDYRASRDPQPRDFS